MEVSLLLDEAKLREIVTALAEGERVVVGAENQSDAGLLHAEVVQRLYQVNHLWTEDVSSDRSYSARTSSGGVLEVEVKPVPVKSQRRSVKGASRA